MVQRLFKGCGPRVFTSYLALLFILISCTKDSEDIPVKSDSYTIYLGNGYRINRVDHLISDSLVQVEKFIYSPQAVKIEVTDKFNKLTRTSLFYLNNLNRADSCLDSIYSNSELTGLQLNIYRYDYYGYLIQTNLWIKSLSDGSILTGTELHYEIQNGNVHIFTVESCGGENYYTELESKIDIFGFLGDFVGKRNRKLKKSYNYECRSLPSSAPESGEYEYTLNSQGLVTERIETYYCAGYKEIRKTSFDYVFQ